MGLKKQSVEDLSMLIDLNDNEKDAFCLILKPFHFFNKTFHINITT